MDIIPFVNISTLKCGFKFTELLRNWLSKDAWMLDGKTENTKKGEFVCTVIGFAINFST